MKMNFRHVLLCAAVVALFPLKASACYTKTECALAYAGVVLADAAVFAACAVPEPVEPFACGAAIGASALATATALNVCGNLCPE